MPFLKLEQLNNTDIQGILSYPLTGDFYFWGEILLAIFLIITLSLFHEEKRRLGSSNLLSSASIGSIAVIVLAIFGSLFGIVTKTILATTIILGTLIIFIWFLKQD